MSFKVEIEVEIDGYNDKICGFCQYRDEMIPWCECFKRKQEYGYNDINGFLLLRCPECLEAEKKYKEKENERTAI